MRGRTRLGRAVSGRSTDTVVRAAGAARTILPGHPDRSPTGPDVTLWKGLVVSPGRRLGSGLDAGDVGVFTARVPRR